MCRCLYRAVRLYLHDSLSRMFRHLQRYLPGVFEYLYGKLFWLL